MALENCLSGDLVLLVILLPGRLGIRLFVPADLGIIRTLDTAPRGVFRLGEVARATDAGDLPDGNAVCQLLCQFRDLMLAHAVHEQVCAAVHQNGRADGVVPVVIVGEPPQGRLQTANSNGGVGISLPDLPAVGDNGTVGAQSGFSAGRVHITAALSLGRGVVGDHGVDVAAGHQKRQSRLAETLKVPDGVPVGLGEDSDAVALGFQQPGDNGCPETGVVYIGIAGDVYEIRLGYAGFQKFLHGDREKVGHVFAPCKFAFLENRLSYRVCLFEEGLLSLIMSPLKRGMSRRDRGIITKKIFVIYCSRRIFRSASCSFVISTFRGFAPS